MVRQLLTSNVPRNQQGGSLKDKDNAAAPFLSEIAQNTVHEAGAESDLCFFCGESGNYIRDSPKNFVKPSLVYVPK